MNAIKKAFKKLSEKEKEWIKNILIALKTNNMQGLDIKALKGHHDIVRVRKGNVRILFRRREEEISVLMVERRNENMYK